MTSEGAVPGAHAGHDGGIMGKIRYLKQQEKQKTRAMYEEIFPEDSKEFVDYYYKWKAGENRILIMEESGMLQVMMHLNPYTLWIHGHLRELPYIVAVATHPDCRRQGKMGQVMKQALQDLARQNAPFTFLLPADSAYYHGQGFVFAPCQDVWSSFPAKDARNQQEKADDKSQDVWSPFPAKGSQEKLFQEFQWQEAREADIPEMVEFSNNILEENYHIFIKRDAHYYQRLFAEIRAEQGKVLLLKSKLDTARQEDAIEKEKPGLKGILIYGVEGKKAEIQEILLETRGIPGKYFSGSEPYPAEAGGQQALEACKEALPGMEIVFSEFSMMLRIANLREFVSLIKCEKARCYDVKVRDEMISGNCGCFRIEVCKDGGRMQEIPEEEAKEEMDIQALARMLLMDTHVYVREWV